MVLAEEAGVEAARLGELRFGDDLVDAAVEVLAARRIGDRAVEAEFHGDAIPLILDMTSAANIHRRETRGPPRLTRSATPGMCSGTWARSSRASECRIRRCSRRW